MKNEKRLSARQNEHWVRFSPTHLISLNGIWSIIFHESDDEVCITVGSHSCYRFSPRDAAPILDKLGLKLGSDSLGLK